MQAKSAKEQGLIEGTTFLSLMKQQVGEIFNIEQFPEIVDGKYGEQVQIPTNRGLLQTTNKGIIGNIRSPKEKSLGGMIRKSLENGFALPVRVIEDISDKGNKFKTITVV